MTERIRTTISLSPEAYDVFKRMAEAGNLSTSRCMGDWLADTIEAAEMITVKMEEAKRAPMRAVREMRAMVAGMVLTDDAAQVRGRSQPGLTAARARTDRAGGAGVPPSSNTGVLVPSLPGEKPFGKRLPKGKTV